MDHQESASTSSAEWTRKPWLGRTILGQLAGSEQVRIFWAQGHHCTAARASLSEKRQHQPETNATSSPSFFFSLSPFTGTADLPARFNYRLQEVLVFGFGSPKEKWLTLADGAALPEGQKGLHGKGSSLWAAASCEIFQLILRMSWKQNEKWPRNVGLVTFLGFMAQPRMFRREPRNLLRFGTNTHMKSYLLTYRMMFLNMCFKHHI